jgi:hypothetical protein
MRIDRTAQFERVTHPEACLFLGIPLPAGFLTRRIGEQKLIPGAGRRNAGRRRAVSNSASRSGPP